MPDASVKGGFKPGASVKGSFKPEDIHGDGRFLVFLH
jgi:hypothetical protein